MSLHQQRTKTSTQMSMLYKDNFSFVKINIQPHACVRRAIIPTKNANLISPEWRRKGPRNEIYTIGLKKCLYFGYSAKNVEKTRCGCSVGRQTVLFAPKNGSNQTRSSFPQQQLFVVPSWRLSNEICPKEFNSSFRPQSLCEVLSKSGKEVSFYKEPVKSHQILVQSIPAQTPRFDDFHFRFINKYF